MTRRLSILHTRVVTGSGGGPDKTILRSAAHIDRDRFDMAAAYLYPAGDHGINTLRETARSFDIPLHTVPERGPFDRRAIRMMIDLCRRRHVDIWHSHDYKSDLLGLLLRRYHPMKLVTTVHGFTRETWRTRLYAKLNNLAFLGYDQVLAVSPQLVRHCAEHGVNPARIAYIPNAIVLREYTRQQSRQQAREALGVPGDGPAIAVVSRFSPEKGVDRAIRLFRELLNEQPAATLHLIGDGPQRTMLEQLAEQLGVMPRVRWWGWQKQTRSYLEAMDALLLTSHTEGLPNVVLEAMAVGVPVAATRVGAIPQVLDEGGCGVLLSDDVSAWSRQMLPLLRPTPQREATTRAAMDRVQAHYDFDRRMQRIQSIYRQIIGTNTQEQSSPIDQLRTARAA